MKKEKARQGIKKTKIKKEEARLGKPKTKKSSTSRKRQWNKKYTNDRTNQMKNQTDKQNK